MIRPGRLARGPDRRSPRRAHTTSPLGLASFRDLLVDVTGARRTAGASGRGRRLLRVAGHPEPYLHSIGQARGFRSTLAEVAAHLRRFMPITAPRSPAGAHSNSVRLKPDPTRRRARLFD